MKKYIFLFITLFCLSVSSQSVIGAWERSYLSDEGEKLTSVVIFSEGYQVISIFKSDSGEFVYSNGGTWSLNGDIMTEKVEFDTGDPERVGSEVSFKVVVDERTLSLPENDRKWNRIDDGNPGELQGAWLMAGRVRDGQKRLRDTSGPRKTMKLLSGTRFQWIAYNIETKMFMGTGGGTYTTIDGKYTENIEFFSRDNSKAGLSLEFNYLIEDDEWNHSGFSSKGDPLHEIWVIRK